MKKVLSLSLSLYVSLFLLIACTRVETGDNRSNWIHDPIENTSCHRDDTIPQDSFAKWKQSWQDSTKGITVNDKVEIDTSILSGFIKANGGITDYPTLRIYPVMQRQCLGDTQVISLIFAQVDHNCDENAEGKPYLMIEALDGEYSYLDSDQARLYSNNYMSTEYGPGSVFESFPKVKAYNYGSKFVEKLIRSSGSGAIFGYFGIREESCLMFSDTCNGDLEKLTMVDVILGVDSTEISYENKVAINFAKPCPKACGQNSLLF